MALHISSHLGHGLCSCETASWTHFVLVSRYFEPCLSVSIPRRVELLLSGGRELRGRCVLVSVLS